MYDASIGRWNGVDALGESNPNWTPYRFSFNNPISYNDPTGNLEKVVIGGEDANLATEELNKSTSLEITRDQETGQLSYSGIAETEADKALKDAIDSEIITVTVTTVRENTYLDDGQEVGMAGGAFLGSTISTEGSFSIRAEQLVNINHFEKISSFTGESVGDGIFHEVNEAWFGANINPGGNYDNTFRAAHSMAMQAGPEIKEISTYTGYNPETGKYKSYIGPDENSFEGVKAASDLQLGITRDVQLLYER